MHPLLARLSATLLGLALVVARPALAGDEAAQDPLVDGRGNHELQVIGWSADDQRFAVRLYERDIETFEPVKKPLVCEGYVDHRGKRFRGTLRLRVYEGDRVVANHVIQQKEPCTPTDKATARLAAAKEDLARLGIDLTRTGTVRAVPWVVDNRLSIEERGKLKASMVVKQGPGAPYTLQFVNNLRFVMGEGGFDNHASGKQQVYLRHEGKRRQVAERAVKAVFMTAMAGHWEAGFSEVIISPSGQKLVVVGYERDSSMRHRARMLRLVGVVDAPSVAVELK
jgi:hypothetical protein